MSFDLNHTYLVSSGIADPQAISMRPGDANLQGKEAVLTAKTNSQPKWHLYKGANSTYTIAVAGEDSKRIFISGGKAWVEVDRYTEFSIESAGPSHGDNSYRIHVPGQDQVLKASGGDDGQVTVAKADGTSAEVWYFDVWHREG